MIKQLVNFYIFHLGYIRAKFWKIFCKKIGKGVFILKSCQLLSPEKIIIGDYSGINHHVVLAGSGGLEIGKHVGIGQYSAILTFNHKYNDPNKPICIQGYKYKPVVIEDDVWIGSHVVILPGVRIGHGSIVGAGSVCCHDVKPYTIVGGNPAKKIGMRFSRNQLKNIHKTYDAAIH